MTDEKKTRARKPKLRLVELEPRRRPANPFLVEQLERMLVLANEGEMQAVAAVYVRSDGGGGSWCAGVTAASISHFVGELEDAKATLLDQARRMREELGG